MGRDGTIGIRGIFDGKIGVLIAGLGLRVFDIEFEFGPTVELVDELAINSPEAPFNPPSIIGTV